MNLPDVTPKILEGLANGKVCALCEGSGDEYTDMWGGGCSKCKNERGIPTGRTEPDLRTIDAMVGKWFCKSGRELGEKSELHKDTQYYGIPGTKTYLLDPPHYTTKWESGGPLLEKSGQNFSIDFAFIDYRVVIHRPHEKDIFYEHPSELVARVCAWLLWKEATK